MVKKSTKTGRSAHGNLAVVAAKLIRSVSWLSILESVIIAILGAIFIAKPMETQKLIFYAVGLFLIVKSVYKILNYFALHAQGDFYNNDLLYGVIGLVFGILIVAMWEQFSGVIALVVGTWVIYGSLVRLGTVMRLHAAGAKVWVYALLAALLTLALGIYMIISLSSGVIIALVGWGMIISAILCIVDDVIFLRNIDLLSK